MRWIATVCCMALLAPAAQAQPEGDPAPQCFRKHHVPAVYERSKRLLRKARLVHDETASGQIAMTHFPAIYIEKKTLISPAHVVLKQVRCTKAIIRKADRLPAEECLATKGCTEIDPANPLTIN